MMVNNLVGGGFNHLENDGVRSMRKMTSLFYYGE